MMDSLYVVGGQQGAPRSLLVGDGYWYNYQKGLILQVSLETGKVTCCVEYISPPDVCAEGDSILFKGAARQGDRLYACTQTEVLIYQLPSFEQVGYISLPCFNDLHHALPTSWGTLLLANSGLEMVIEITPNGEVLREWNVLGEPPWAHFSREVDYRKGVNTKPHRSHPNYLFLLGDEIWVTRFHQKDALCLTNPARRIEIGLERVHDGVLHNGQIYFTTVDGHVVLVNADSLQVEEVIDLGSMHDEDLLLGWCRGLLIDGERVWVGFSRIRPTRFRENISWVMRGFKRGAPTQLGCYDLAKRQCVAEINLEPYGLNALFSILPTTLPAPQKNSAEAVIKAVCYPLHAHAACGGTQAQGG